ncbi:unnamed protein product [Lactuca virosa]|uniref:DUF659 domain-containing protein n=1 Tax=Lactuca virosa TaxID=75947 RepID=A0AAU9MII5_9ASTR|nr:unnamed protein product [Lactuca virosa]
MMNVFKVESDGNGTVKSVFNKGKQKTMNQALEDREPVTRALCRLIYGEALPFNLVKSPLWKEALRLVGEYGKGLKLPSYHEARVTYLKKEVECVEKGLNKYKEEWKKTRCTLMSDGWTDGKQRSITNFLVNSPSGTVFVKSVDTSSFAKDANKLFEILNSIVKEIREENVVQVVTDSTSAYVLAGSKLEQERPRLYWSPCSAHLIDLMLQEIGGGKTFKDTLDKARKLTVYIYRHCVLLSMFRRFTGGQELTRVGVTRFATSFLTLKRFQELKHRMRQLFASNELAESTFTSKDEGKLAERITLVDVNFWKAIKYYLSCVVPIYKNFNVNKEVKCGLYDVIERMYNRPTMVTIHEQLVKFNESMRMFGIFAAVLMKKKMQPAKWWSSYGDECPKDEDDDDHFIPEV